LTPSAPPALPRQARAYPLDGGQLLGGDGLRDALDPRLRGSM